jgi:hypothetical protein
MVVLNALFFFAVLSGTGSLAVLAGGVKAGLYFSRKLGSAPQAGRVPMWLSWLRITTGFVVPGLLWVFNFELFYPLILVVAGFAEMIDRAEFYEEIDLVTPQKQIDRDLMSACRKSPSLSMAALVGLAARACQQSRRNR